MQVSHCGQCCIVSVYNHICMIYPTYPEALSLSIQHSNACESP